LTGPGVRKHVVGADIFGQTINPSDPNETAEEIRYQMRRHARREIPRGETGVVLPRSEPP